MAAKQGVARKGRKTTGSPWIVGRPTARAPGAAHPPATLQTKDADRRRRQTPARKTIRGQ